VVSKDSVDPNETADIYLAQIIQNFRQDSNHPDFTIISTDTKNSKLAGIPGYELLYSNKEPTSDSILLNDEVGTVIDGKAYCVTYTAAESRYPIYKPAINQMFDSLIIYLRSELKSTGQNKNIAGIPINPEDIAET